MLRIFFQGGILSSESRVESELLDAAHTNTLVNCNAGEALFTPADTPGILDDPVVNAVDHIATPANNGDRVVSVVTTLVGIQDAALIEAEDLTIGLDKSGDWAKGDCNFEISNVVAINLFEAGGSHWGDLRLLKLAGRFIPNVRVILSLHHALVLSVGVRSINTPIIATIIAILIFGSVDQLLNRENIEGIIIPDIAAGFHNRCC